MMVYYVSNKGNDTHAGSQSDPFKTINHAAKIAAPGDTVRVHGGTYREWVDPQNGGLNDSCRITYEAVEGEIPVIKGSELVTDWERVEDSVYKKILPNAMFNDFNPFFEKVEGDWLVKPDEYDVHLGDVYLNGVSMFEAQSLQALKKAEIRYEGFGFRYTAKGWENIEKIPNPERTRYQWYAEVGEKETTLWCNFGQIDPNTATVEINVRRSCFFPRKVGVNYITVRGFEMAHAATPFTPPTADQPGMIGPHWSRGWIIENNHLHDAKCSAVSLGKEISTGHNLYTRFMRKRGYQNQIESMFLGLQAGWCKEKIGSHIVRNNVIHDCGQNGIVGHMGCAFSRIEHNHIYNITRKGEFWGYEIGGIKLHAAIDVVIENNNIHDCCLGTWLDWQAQGARITRNLYHSNERDLMIEVTHGPCTVDNNLFLSRHFIDDAAQGTAFVHNVILGYQKNVKILDRATPYHFPHTTQVAGVAVVLGGDDRVFNNVILGNNAPLNEKLEYISTQLDAYSTEEEYLAHISKLVRDGDKGTFDKVPQPVWFDGNAYSGYAKPHRSEKAPIDACGMEVSLVQKDGDWILTLDVPMAVAESACKEVDTMRLGFPRITEAPFDAPDGSPIDFGKDLLGKQRGDRILPGPFASLETGINTITVWRASKV